MRQIHKYVKFREEIPRKELAEFFGAVKNTTFNSALHDLKKRGAIIADEHDVYRPGAAEEIVACRADRAWKAARIMRTFTSRELAITAELDRQYVSDLFATWVAQDYIVQVGRKDKLKLYKMLSKEIIRPRLARKTRRKP
ncbi:MAG: hypothetical protein ACPKOP_04190 [Sphaerochaetaceae bacterium]